MTLCLRLEGQVLESPSKEVKSPRFSKMPLASSRVCSYTQLSTPDSGDTPGGQYQALVVTNLQALEGQGLGSLTSAWP